MKENNRKAMFMLGLILCAVAGSSLSISIPGWPLGYLGLFGFGVVLIIAALAQRNRAA